MGPAGPLGPEGPQGPAGPGLSSSDVRMADGWDDDDQEVVASCDPGEVLLELSYWLEPTPETRNAYEQQLIPLPVRNEYVVGERQTLPGSITLQITPDPFPDVSMEVHWTALCISAA